MEGVPEVLKAIVLGIVQGLTEFLPISSTGHLILTERVLGISADDFGLRFDAAIHLGTLAAVLLYFRWTILSYVGGFLESIRARKWDVSRESRLAWFLLLGTIPAGIAGYFLESTVENSFREPVLVGLMLILFTLPMYAAERFGSRTRELGQLRAVDALTMGVAQAVALIPGVSRSGITISAGMLRGFRRDEAATFVFLLSAPVIAAAGGKQLFDVITGSSSQSGLQNEALVYATGLITAAVVGYLAVAFLLQFLRVNSLRVFIYYRLVLGALVLLLAAAGVL